MYEKAAGVFIQYQIVRANALLFRKQGS